MPCGRTSVMPWRGKRPTAGIEINDKQTGIQENQDMTRWNRLNTLRKGLVIGGLGLIVCVVVVACAVRQRATGPQQTADGTLPPSERETLTAQTPVQDRAETAAQETPKQLAPPKKQEPLSPEAIAMAHGRIEAASSDYGARLEARRSLFHRLCKQDQLDLAMGELEALLEDVQQQEGSGKAQRVAFAEAGTLEARKDHHAAVRAHELLLDRYGEGRFAAEAMYHLGTCHLELQEYARAEQVWRRLIEEHDDSPHAPWGWRKLALAQLLQGRFDTALGTLEVMAGKYAGTHFGDYASMRRGYVQAAAGRPLAARESYEVFLAEFPHSKYGRLVHKQMAELEAAGTLARAIP